MKIKIAEEEYLTRARALSEEESERLLSRMSGKLPKRLHKDKLSKLEAMAIQLELEDEMLREWRERMAEIKKKDEAEAADLRNGKKTGKGPCAA